MTPLDYAGILLITTVGAIAGLLLARYSIPAEWAGDSVVAFARSGFAVPRIVAGAAVGLVVGMLWVIASKR